MRKTPARKAPVPPVNRRRRANAKEPKQPAAPKQARLPGEDERIAERRVKALELRKVGASYRRIAQQLDISVETAWSDVQAELGALRAVAEKEAENIRELELRRLDEWTLNLAPKARAGDHRAVMALVRIQERRARLLGIDAPTRAELTGKNGAPLAPAASLDLSRLSAAELATLEAIVAKTAQPQEGA